MPTMVEELTGASWGVVSGGMLYWDNGKENENYRDYGGSIRVYIGIIGNILGP